MSQEEVLNGSPYWVKVREGFFVHNKNWQTVIEQLPDLISAERALSKLQSPNQILNSGIGGLGSVGHEVFAIVPDSEALIDHGFLNDGFYNIENLFLQWVAQFVVVEGISSHFHQTPLPLWNPTFITMVEEHLHVMTYIAALIYLYELTELKALVTKGNFIYSEGRVKDKIKELALTLYSKGAEYGESYRRHGLQGTLPRLWDKIARYAHLSALGRSANYEPKLDSAKDLLGYCIIAWSLVHEL